MKSMPPPGVVNVLDESEYLAGLEPVQPTNMNRLLQERLIRYIRQEGLGARDKLPSQQRLAKSLGVSTIALREALRSLEALGILEVHVGSGWYVRPFSFEPIVKGLLLNIDSDAQTLADLGEIRVILECAFIGAAGRRLTAADLDALHAYADAMLRRAETGLPWHDLDQQFHTRLFSNVRNKIFVKWMEVFWALYSYLGEDINQEDSLNEARKHRPIVDALRAGELDRVTHLLHDSLSGSARRVTRA